MFHGISQSQGQLVASRGSWLALAHLAIFHQFGHRFGTQNLTLRWCLPLGAEPFFVGIYGGVLKWGPKKWLVYVMENPI